MPGDLRDGRQRIETSVRHAPSGCAPTVLESIEDEIYEESGRIVSSKLRICALLSEIMTCQHYRQAGYEDFKSYLKTERIPVKYKTGCAYARIGELLRTYARELKGVDFTDEDGIEKIRYLEIALQNYPTERGLVFFMLKTSTFRSFLSFAKAKESPCFANGRSQADSVSRRIQPCRLRVEDDTIVALFPDGARKDVIWLNPSVFDTISRYQLFLEDLKKAVRKHFCGIDQ